MGYDRGERLPLDFEPNGIPFGSKSMGNLSPRSYPIQFERKWNKSFLSVGEGAATALYAGKILTPDFLNRNCLHV